MSFAFVFPGQGSQSLKMLDGILTFPDTKTVFSKAKKVLGIDFLAMLQEETTDNINQTVNTQPLMLASGLATYLLWREHKGVKPTVMAGHSLGEWTALVASGVILFSDALKLVKLRALAMQEAVPIGEGAMGAVLGLDDETVIKVCAEVEHSSGEVVAGVNFNSPGQVVIAGTKKAVDLALIALKENGAKKVQLLPISVPAHSKLMLPASKKLASALASVEFRAPQIKVLHNYDTGSYNDVVLIKEALVKQLYSPVLWSRTINKIVDMNINQILECGPGKVLSGLNKRISGNIISYNLHNQADLDKALAELKL
ncbi:MAG: malonyl CoA-acyl carrier protein transacylase [Burkholderiales bacterium]|jgi:[acyl-carrier-protein] S-malonyltransferase|nr:malonyl CoA-acyl carrier protein transacylase [Burkholderiales bacterium]